MQSGIDRLLLQFVVLLDIGSINVHGSIFVLWGQSDYSSNHNEAREERELETISLFRM